MKYPYQIKFNSLFKNLDDAEYNQLYDNIRLINFKKGENVCKTGTSSTHVIYVNQGYAKVIFEGTNGKSIIANFLKKGDFIGLSALGGLNIYNFSVVSLNYLETVFIDKKIFNDLVFNNKSRNKELINFFCNYIEQQSERYVQLGTKQVHGRLADAIIELSDDNFPDLYNYLNRNDLAEYVGMSVKSMIRSLRELKNDGIIHIQGKKIVIKNRDLLNRLSKIG